MKLSAVDMLIFSALIWLAILGGMNAIFDLPRDITTWLLLGGVGQLLISGVLVGHVEKSKN